MTLSVERVAVVAVCDNNVCKIAHPWFQGTVNIIVSKEVAGPCVVYEVYCDCCKVGFGVCRPRPYSRALSVTVSLDTLSIVLGSGNHEVVILVDCVLLRLAMNDCLRSSPCQSVSAIAY